MLRFANITLSNPAKPDIPAIKVQAIVTAEDFLLTIGDGLAARLQLGAAAPATAATRANDRQSMKKPVVGPVHVACGSAEMSVNAVQCGSGAVIGKRLGEQLQSSSLSRAADKQALIGRILIKEKAIDAKTIKRLLGLARGRKSRPAVIAGGKVKPDIRAANTVDTKGIKRELNALFCGLYIDYIEPFFGAAIEKWEEPQLLSYVSGGKYDAHIDGDKWVKPKDGGKGEWKRILDRDVSVVLYLNDDFEGGDLHFPDLDFKIKPKPGLLVAFPSTHEYLHGAELVESGERVVLVSWASKAGMPHAAVPPHNTVWMKNFRGQT